ncbi:hypothetical protein F5890DRAFT_1558330 [Lentinula detonsa]|uniref:WD40 repeat-like protein n=1 Tax=Lentinula detonsa TaxID=2804962 RepID=A0AA38PR48_9AGAR|nr:hypothetical protein F5890DRAFT_1558330 [Lentinula detonsa]
MPLHWIESDRITIPNASTRGRPIIDASLSHSAHFLAVGYGKQIEVWDLRKTVSKSPLSVFGAKSSLLTSFSWAPGIPRLAAGYEDGVVYVASLNEKSAAVEGFNLQAPSLVISTVFLHKDLLAVATTQAVELHSFQYEDGERSWILAGFLPNPPAIVDGPNQNIRITSIHVLAEDRVLVHYGAGPAVIWVITLRPFACRFESVSRLPGRIDDFCKENNLLLLTDTESGTYQVFQLGSQIPHCQFYPQTLSSPRSSQPVSRAKWLSKDVVVGGGVGQLVLWGIHDVENRLQNLTYRNQGE